MPIIDTGPTWYDRVVDQARRQSQAPPAPSAPTPPVEPTPPRSALEGLGLHGLPEHPQPLSGLFEWIFPRTQTGGLLLDAARGLVRGADAALWGVEAATRGAGDVGLLFLAPITNALRAAGAPEARVQLFQAWSRSIAEQAAMLYPWHTLKPPPPPKAAVPWAAAPRAVSRAPDIPSDLADDPAVRAALAREAAAGRRAQRGPSPFTPDAAPLPPEPPAALRRRRLLGGPEGAAE